MWVISGSNSATSGANSMLHAPALNEYETDMLSRQGMYFGGEVLCTAHIEEMDLPGPKMARLAQRCAKCCKEVGYPTGIGSPIHDAEIRVLIGLDKPVVPIEWADVSERHEAIRLLCEQWVMPDGTALADDYREGRSDMAKAILRVLNGLSQEETLASA
jgi:hypothetical protein